MDKFYVQDIQRRRSLLLQKGEECINIDADDLNSECAAPCAAIQDDGGEEVGLNCRPGCGDDTDLAEGVPHPPKRSRKSAAMGRDHCEGDVPSAPSRACKQAPNTGLPPSWLSVIEHQHSFDDDNMPHKRHQHHQRQQQNSREANFQRSSSMTSSSSLSSSSSCYGHFDPPNKMQTVSTGSCSIGSSSINKRSERMRQSGSGNSTFVPVVCPQQAAGAARANAQEIVLSFMKSTAKKQGLPDRAAVASIKEEAAEEPSKKEEPLPRSSSNSLPRQDPANATRPGKSLERSVSFSADMEPRPDQGCAQQQNALMLARTTSSSSSSTASSSSSSSSCSTRSGADPTKEGQETWVQTLGKRRSLSSMEEKAKVYRARVVLARRSDEEKQ